MLVALLVCWLLARVTERPLSEVFTALALHGQHFPPFQTGHRPPARRRLLPGASPTSRSSPPPGCSRRGDGVMSRLIDRRRVLGRQPALVGRLGRRHAGGLRRRAADRLGRSRRAATALGAGCWCWPRSSCASCGRAPPRPTGAHRRAHAGRGSTRSGARRRRALLRRSRTSGRRRSAQPLEQGSPQAGGGARRALAGALDRGARCRSCSSSWPTRRWRARPRLELGRIRDALLSGLGLAGALVFAFAIAYVASERDGKVDLSYFRTAAAGRGRRARSSAPSTSRSRSPRSSRRPTRSREQVDSYFDDLAKESSQLKVTHYDFDVDPAKAKELGVTTNGMLVFARGDPQGAARPRAASSRRRATPLKTLDKEVQQRLMLVVEAAAHGWVSPPATASGPGTGRSTPTSAPGSRPCATCWSTRATTCARSAPPTASSPTSPRPSRWWRSSAPRSRSSPRRSRRSRATSTAAGACSSRSIPSPASTSTSCSAPLSLTYKPELLANDQTFAPAPTPGRSAQHRDRARTRRTRR